MLVYTITKGNNKSYVYDIYHGIQGPQGIQGIQGEQGIQGVPGTAATISVGSVTSGSTPSVTNVGTSNAAIFDFVLEKGDKGDQGDKGQAAGFGTPTASATALPVGSEPTASVTASGDPTQKVFDFEFGIPAGSDSWNITVKTISSNSITFDVFKNGSAFSGSLFFRMSYGDGTTMTRTSTDTMITASSGVMSITSSEVSNIATILANVENTILYFEFKSSFAGSNFYTINYNRAKNDTWHAEKVEWNLGTSLRIFGIMKNGNQVTGPVTVNVTINEQSSDGYWYPQFYNNVTLENGEITLSNIRSSFNADSIGAVVSVTLSSTYEFLFSIPIFLSKPTDVWDLRELRAVVTSLQSQIDGYVYKNNQVITNTQLRGNIKAMYKSGAMYDYTYSWTATTGSDGRLTITSAQCTNLPNILGNKDIAGIFVSLFDPDDVNTIVVKKTIYFYQKASAIASGDYGYTTGDQVYQIVGDVETLLAAL